ncbi:hypothetical protein [Dysgonomonas sp. Marseille-P4361]|nr:hypothetical protein [Dysgonomonas sp. Marseille-P4361]
MKRDFKQQQVNQPPSAQLVTNYSILSTTISTVSSSFRMCCCCKQ